MEINPEFEKYEDTETNKNITENKNSSLINDNTDVFRNLLLHEQILQDEIRILSFKTLFESNSDSIRNKVRNK